MELLKKMWIILILTTSFSNAQTSTLLTKGTPAPFSGTLIRNERVNELVKAEKRNILLEELSIKQDQRVEIYRTEASRLETQLARAQFKSFWTNVGFFALGVVVTGVAAKAAIESVR